MTMMLKRVMKIILQFLIVTRCHLKENEMKIQMLGGKFRTNCLRDRMRLSFPLPLLSPCSLVGFFILVIVTGAQIPDGMLIEDRMVAPPHPPETPRQHLASSANREEHKSMNAMDDGEGEDQIIDGEEGPTCYVEIQVTRRIPGRCVSLGRSRGCVAGVYINPFDHECL